MLLYMTTLGKEKDFLMVRRTREISWVKSALKAFQKFPVDVRDEMTDALTQAAEGDKADIAKPMKSMGSGVMEIALPYRGDAFRTIYCLRLDDDLWVVHAFQKKSKIGIKTPKQEIDLIKQRIKRIKEMQK